MPSTDPPRGTPYLFLTDAPPRLEGAIGGSILAWNLVQALREILSLVATRSGSVDRQLALPIFVYPDAYLRGRRRFPSGLHEGVEWLLFLLWLPALRRAARRHGCQRILAMCCTDSWFLLKADGLRRVTGLPLDIYLIDDLAESDRLGKRRLGGRVTAWVEPRVLRRASRVFTISPGYAEHLHAKFGQDARWLPVPAEPGAGHSPYQPSVPDRRALVFLGSVNALYLDSLAEIYRQIVRWNASPDRPYALCLRLYTRHVPTDLLDLLPDRDGLELCLDTTAAELHAALRQAWSIVLPYSFDPVMRVMVNTSFSHKFTESIGAGRPILVYGPADASIPRYFRENALPLCATNPAELTRALGEIERCDGPKLIGRYQALAHLNHSPAALRQILAGE